MSTSAVRHDSYQDFGARQVFTALEHHAAGESWTKAGVIGTSSALFSADGATLTAFAWICAGLGGLIGGVGGGKPWRTGWRSDNVGGESIHT